MKELEVLKKKGYTAADLKKLRMKVLGEESPTKEKDLAEIDAMIDDIPDEDLSKKESVKKDAIRKVGALVKELIGERSIRRTADEAGVAASYITGILKEKYLPSADILRKLASAEAKPQNGVTLEDLMVAAGYQTDYVEEAYKQMVFDEIVDGDSVIEMDPHDGMEARLKAYAEKMKDGRTSHDFHRERLQERERYESLASAVIYKVLAEKGIHFSAANDQVGIRGYKPNMMVYVPKQPILEWWFDFKDFDLPASNRRNNSFVAEDRNKEYRIRQMLGRLIFVEPKLERKISIVVNDKDAFGRMVGYKDKLAYRGDLSVILIDESSLSVIDEVYLSHYKERDTKTEFYVV